MALTACASATTLNVNSGALVLNLDANAFATGVEPRFYSGCGLTMTFGQPHIVVGRYFSRLDMVGKQIVGTGLRPDLNGLRPVSNVGTAAVPVWSVDIRQFRSAFNAAPPATTCTVFEVYTDANIPTGRRIANRFPQATDFIIDSSGDWNTASGLIGFGGGILFLYSNDAFLSYPNSGRYTALGDFTLSYATPNPGYSGWVIHSNVMGTTLVFETTNVPVKGNDLSITGGLFTSCIFPSRIDPDGKQHLSI